MILLFYNHPNFYIIREKETRIGVGKVTMNDRQ